MPLNTFVAGNSGSMRQLAGSLRTLGSGVEDTATGYHKTRGESETIWEGQAADAFRADADRQGHDADRLAQLHTDLATAVTAFADDLDTVNARMAQARQVADAGQLLVFASLIFPPSDAPPAPPTSVANPTLPGTPSAPNPAAAALHAQQQAAYSEAEAAVNQARNMERTAHQKLLDACKANSTGLDQLCQFPNEWLQTATSPTTPAAAALANAAAAMGNWAAGATEATFEQAVHDGPAAVHGMWMSLTPDQQTELIDRNSNMVGNTDGVPALARDQANRSTLYSKLASLAAVAQPNSKQRQQRQELQDLLDGLDRGGTHRLLLGFNPEANSDRGQAIVANGDPDTADNVLTNVSGTGTQLNSFGNDPRTDEIHKIDTIADLARQTDPNHSTATIAWVDYKTPQFSNLANSPAGESDAIAGQHNLAQFQNGLHVTHQGPPAHNTIVGHSYGSTVVGYAARSGSLPNSDLVFLGSPGVGVDQSNQLHEAPGHVWAATSPGDRIAGGTHYVIYPYVTPGDGNPPPRPDLQPFGVDPTSPAFGARPLPVDPTGGHSDYYQRQSDLQNIANIAVGRSPQP